MSLQSELGQWWSAIVRGDAERGCDAGMGFEALEDRILLSSAPVMAGYAAQTVLAGSPLYMPLKATDPDGHRITYTVTSSNPSIISTYVPQTNRSLRINVGGMGTMEFQLFEDKAWRATNRIIQLTNSGFYNGVIFHRVINNFMIQGGDPDGTGSGGSPLPDFDDQFHPDLQHNRAGLLSMAKGGDDSNNSQFFITDVSANYPRWLDSNHTIFGLQTAGEAVRDAISNLPTGANDRPVNPPVMTEVSIFRERENGVVMLKAGNGVTSGSATITVMATDATGRSVTRAFVATVAPDTHDNWPYLLPVQTLRTTQDTPITFRLRSMDVDGGTPFYDARLASDIQGVDGQINRNTGVITLVPPPGFTGTFDFEVRVRDASVPDSQQYDAWDSQVVTVTVLPSVAPDAWEAGRGDDTAAAARFVGLNRWQIRTIDAVNDADWMRFTLTQKSRVTIRAAGENATDVRLLLRGPNASNVVPGNPNTAVAAEGAVQTALVRNGLKALEPGTYWVRVDGMGMVVPLYSVRIEVAALPVAAADPTPDQLAALAAWDSARRDSDSAKLSAEENDRDTLLEIEPVLVFPV